MSETQSILINKKTYIKLKKLSDMNECSVNEEIGKAITNSYDDIDESLLEEIDVIPRKDKVFVVLPEDLYSLFEEDDISNGLSLFLDDHVSSSLEDEEESEDEVTKPKKKTNESKGFFDTITEAFGEFVDDLISDEDEEKDKKKKR